MSTSLGYIEELKQERDQAKAEAELWRSMVVDEKETARYREALVQIASKSCTTFITDECHDIPVAQYCDPCYARAVLKEGT